MTIVTYDNTYDTVEADGTLEHHYSDDSEEAKQSASPPPLPPPPQSSTYSPAKYNIVTHELNGSKGRNDYSATSSPSNTNKWDPSGEDKLTDELAKVSFRSPNSTRSKFSVESTPDGNNGNGTNSGNITKYNNSQVSPSKTAKYDSPRGDYETYSEKYNNELSDRYGATYNGNQHIFDNEEYGITSYDSKFEYADTTFDKHNNGYFPNLREIGLIFLFVGIPHRHSLTIGSPSALRIRY